MGPNVGLSGDTFRGNTHAWGAASHLYTKNMGTVTIAEGSGNLLQSVQSPISGVTLLLPAASPGRAQTVVRGSA